MMKRTDLPLQGWTLTLIVHVNVLLPKCMFASSSPQVGDEVPIISTQRNAQDDCAAPSNGCGAGLWDQSKCRCLCITNYCYDEMFGSCATVSLPDETSIQSHVFLIVPFDICNIFCSHFSMDLALAILRAAHLK